jgi:hypothetical protein
MRAALLAAGFSPRMLKRASALAALSKQELESVLGAVKPTDAVDKAGDREIRRVMRARNSTS